MHCIMQRKGNWIHLATHTILTNSTNVASYRHQCNTLTDILPSYKLPNIKVAYVISLGVLKRAWGWSADIVSLNSGFSTVLKDQPQVMKAIHSRILN